jgi:hypothetical protein
VTTKCVQAAKDFYDVVTRISRGASWAINRTKDLARQGSADLWWTSFGYGWSVRNERLCAAIWRRPTKAAGAGCLTFGLVVRREAALWKSWKPWFAAFGLALPSSFLLMGLSLSVSRTSPHWMSPQADGLAMGSAMLLICYVLLLIGWSWSSGFDVGSFFARHLLFEGQQQLQPQS